MFFDILQNPSLAQHAPVYHPDSAPVSTINDFGTPAAIPAPYGSVAPVLLRNDGIQQHEDVEESLSIIDKEKS